MPPVARPLILIADDDSETLDSLTGYLDLEGFACVRALTGAEAMHTLSTQPIQAALLDQGLTPPDALEICRLLRAAPGGRDLPVLVFAFDDDEEAAAFAAGASAVIPKPYHLAAIGAQLREMVPGVPPPRG